GKIEASINNAGRLLELGETEGSLNAYVRTFEPSAADRPKRVRYPWMAERATTAASRALAKDLKRRGWAFVGPTTVYAFMQAMGLVNDHAEGCIVREQAAQARGMFQAPR